MGEKIIKIEDVDKAVTGTPVADTVRHIRSLYSDLPRADSFLFYSGPLQPNGAGGFLQVREGGLWAFHEAKRLVIESKGKIGIIDETPAGRIAFSEQFKANLIDALGEKRANDVLHGAIGPDGKRIANGLVDELSANFAARVDGPINVLAPFPSPTGVLRQSEFTQFVNNTGVPKILNTNRITYADIVANKGIDDAFAKMTHESYNYALQALPHFKDYKFTAEQLTQINYGSLISAAPAAKPIAAEVVTSARALEHAAPKLAEEGAEAALKTGGRMLGKAVKVVPILGTAIGVGINTAEAAELKDKANAFVQNNQLSPDAMTAYTAILGGHAAQGADPSIVGGEAAVQGAYALWREQYNVSNDVSAALQPSSLALMAKDLTGKLYDASVDVASYGIENAADAGASVWKSATNAYDEFSGDKALRAQLYAALPTVEAPKDEDKLSPSTLTNVPPEARALMDTKREMLWMEKYERELRAAPDAYKHADMLNFVRESRAALDDRFREQFDEMRSQGSLPHVYDYVVDWHVENDRQQRLLAEQQAAMEAERQRQLAQQPQNNNSQPVSVQASSVAPAAARMGQ